VSIDSVDFAASLEATAKEIAAAAALYQRLPAQRDDLIAGLGSLTDRLQLEWKAFILHAAKEAASAPRK
jgi:hypothetical protein